jgi:hypothetical protein
MSKHSEICGEGCATNRRKSWKSCRRIPGCLPIFIIYSLLKMSSGATVPDLYPELMNAQNFDFAKPKLFFKNISHYVATSTYIHVRIPFNFTTVFNTKEAIARCTIYYSTNMKKLSNSLQNQSQMSVYRSSKVL